MDRGGLRATAHGITKSDTTEHIHARACARTHAHTHAHTHTRTHTHTHTHGQGKPEGERKDGGKVEDRKPKRLRENSMETEAGRRQNQVRQGGE